MLRTILLIAICLWVNAFVNAQTPGFAKDFQRAEEALLNKQYEKAIRIYQNVLNQQPELHIARRNIGVCYELLGEYDKALEFYEAVIKRDEFFSRSIYFRAGWASYKMGDYEKALTYYGKFEFCLESRRMNSQT
ncbi:MAG: tetratricopeptide repeat protein [Saprospiraceae bacterium]|nr:tetratricopeptide repeat protein [Saprospiraceae bacterium]